MASQPGSSTVTKNVIVKVTVDGDIRAISAMARIEAAQARMMAINARAARGQKDFNQTVEDGSKGMGNNRQATIQAGQQIQDFAIQVQGGQSAMVALTQQGSQLAYVLSGVGGTVGKVAGFFTGLGGTLIFLTVGILLPLVNALRSTEEATDDLREAEQKLSESIVEVLKSRATLDKALGRNSDSYDTARRAAIELGLAELRSAAQAVAAAQTRLKAAIIAEQGIAAARSINEQAGATTGTVGGGGGLINVVRQSLAENKTTQAIKAANAATTELNGATARLNELIAGYVNERSRANKETERSTKQIKEAAAETDKYAEEVKELTRQWDQGGPDIARAREELQKLLEVQKNLTQGDIIASSGDKFDRLGDQIRDLQRIIQSGDSFSAAIAVEFEKSSDAAEALRIRIETLKRILAAQDGSDVGYIYFLNEQLSKAISEAEKLDPLLAKIQEQADRRSKTAAEYNDPAAGLRRQMEEIEEAIAIGDIMGEGIGRAMEKIEELKIKIAELENPVSKVKERITDELVNSIEQAARAIEGAIEGTTKWSEAFEQAGRQIIAMIIRIGLQMAALAAVNAIFGGGSSISKAVTKAFGFAKGGVIDNGVKKFASGGIISSPTYFPMSGGTGLAGEAGPEAIMPLSRDSKGRLGVSSPAVNVNVYNNAPGAEISVRQDGDQIAIIVEQARRAVAADIQRGDGMVSTAIQSVYQVGRARR